MPRLIELILHGYIGQHKNICPCEQDCPLGIALRTNPKEAYNLGKGKRSSKSTILLIAHIEKLYEYYIQK